MMTEANNMNPSVVNTYRSHNVPRWRGVIGTVSGIVCVENDNFVCDADHASPVKCFGDHCIQVLKNI